MSLDIEYLQQWVGRTEQHSDQLVLYPLNALAATLDRQDAEFEIGAPLPPLWHWLYFLPTAKQSQLAGDGHPKKGDFLPPVPLPRRMWAGSRFQFSRSLVAGTEASRISTIKSVDVKQGRSGALAFVCVSHEVADVNGLAFVEEHDIVYRDNPPLAADGAAPVAAPGIATPTDAQFFCDVDPDPVLLFRYSALTFNGHRIHYDREYTTGVEGYPGLIVHGPLLATLLVELLWSHAPDAVMTSFEFKAMRPVFDINSFRVCGKQNESGEYELWIQDHQGFLCMKASAEVEC